MIDFFSRASPRRVSSPPTARSAHPRRGGGLGEALRDPSPSAERTASVGGDRGGLRFAVGIHQGRAVRGLPLVRVRLDGRLHRFGFQPWAAWRPSPLRRRRRRRGEVCPPDFSASDFFSCKPPPSAPPRRHPSARAPAPRRSGWASPPRASRLLPEVSTSARPRARSDPPPRAPPRPSLSPGPPRGASLRTASQPPAQSRSAAKSAAIHRISIKTYPNAISACCRRPAAILAPSMARTRECERCDHLVVLGVPSPARLVRLVSCSPSEEVWQRDRSNSTVSRRRGVRLHVGDPGSPRRPPPPQRRGQPWQPWRRQPWRRRLCFPWHPPWRSRLPVGSQGRRFRGGEKRLVWRAPRGQI